MPRPRLPDDERKRRRAAATARYRIKMGQIPGAVGRPPKNESRTREIVGGVMVVKQERNKIKLPGDLPENPTPEDMKRFVVEMARCAAEAGSAPAMIAAAQTLQKEIDRWERTRPPVIEQPKPRPRIGIEVEVEKVKCPHCGQTFDL